MIKQNAGGVDMLTALILFLATYAALLAFSKFRTYIALSSAALFVILGILPVGKVLPAVDWNVIMMIMGTMGIVFLFIAVASLFFWVIDLVLAWATRLLTGQGG